LIEIRNLTKKFNNSNDSIIVNNLNLDINDGEILEFAGLNGAGKTTTTRMASGLLKATSGSVSIDGYDIIVKYLTSDTYYILSG
jgi:ABC-2 type transport system ATP-binding protein